LSAGGAQKLRVTLERSPLVALAVVIIHAGTALLVAYLPLPIAAAAAAYALIAASAAWSLWRHAFRAGRAGIETIVVRADRTVEIGRRSGAREECMIADSSVVTAWLTLMHAFPKDRRHWPWHLRAVLIAPDMLSTDDYRQLRVLLRMGKPARAAKPV